MSAAQQRKTWDIHGGVHPAENKHQSVRNPIQQAPIPETLTYPLSQHIGAPAEPIVEVGEYVLKGQMIAKAGGFVSVPVHASTSGQIVAIENADVIHSSGMTAPAIILKPDGKDEWIELDGIDDYKSLEKPDLINRIRDAGIAGMGGAGFPSAVKLNTRPDQEITTLIINGTECEPYITADDILMRERADQIIQGALILQHIVDPEEVLIGVEDNKPEGIAALRAAAEGTDVEVVVFPTKYPSGGEKQLIQILTGKEVPNGGLPADIGIVCQNIGTTVAIYKAVTFGEPLVSRITTVTGNAVENQQNYEVLLGTPARFLLDQSGYQPEKAARLIAGGPMMGFAIENDQVPVVKSTNCLLVPTEQELPTPPPAQACIRCGMCAEACPVSLLPQQLYWFAQSKNHDGLKDHHLMDCIECGACSFACPSNIPLVQYYRASKADIRQTEADARKADYSKQRYEARQERLAKVEAEKERKRLERQQKAAKAAEAKDKKATDDQAAVQAALERTKAAKAAAPADDDPVAAAIARAKAKASGEGVDPVAEAKSKIEGLEKRLEKAKAKLQTAKETNDENVAAFESSVEKLEAKLAEAKAAAPSAEPAADIPADDPVAAAIARAKAKAEGKDVATDPVAEAKAKVASLEKRLEKAEAKVKAAEESGDDNLVAFETSVEKLKAKLEEAKAAVPADAAPAAAEEAVDMSDPVAAAIARAKAKAAGKDVATDPVEEAKAKVASLEKRLEKAEAKVKAAEESGDDNLVAFETSVEKLKAKLEEAKAALPAETAEEAPKAEAQEEAVDMDDPVAAAIARAKAKRAGTDDDVDPQEKLEKDIASLNKRIEASKEKLAAAEAEGSDKADAFKASVEKLEGKLADAQAELNKLTGQAEEQQPEPAPEAAPAVDMNDPVQAAIERAKAKRANAEDLDPSDKLKQDIASLEKRIATTEQKLEGADDDKAEILQTSLDKLKDKLEKAQQELEAL